MQKNRWIVASMFAWCLAGSVALAVSSGRSPIQADAAPLELVPADETPSTPEAEAPKEGQELKKPATAPKQKGPALKAIQWETSFEGAMKKAKAQGKPVMIDFYTDWCHWCKELDKKVYTDKVVIAESAKWISVKIDAEKRADVAKSYGVTGYPTIAFVEGTGKPLSILPGYQEAPGFAQTMREAYEKRTPGTRA